MEVLVCKGQQDLNNNDEWNKWRKNRLNSLPGAQRIVIAGANDVDQSVY
jgi:hypothetical protein